jgi:hypothetical protein
MKLFLSNITQTTKEVPTQVQRFRYGKDYAISSNTDTFGVGAPEMEFLSWKYGVRSTVYESMNGSAVIRDQYTQKIFECSIYWLANKYSDPTDKAIPDYTSSNYSSLGEAAFNVIDGDPKLQRYPNNGTQLFHITGGRLGVKLNRALNSWDMGQEGITLSDTFDPTNITDDSLFIDEVGTEGDGFSATFAKNINTSPQRHKCFSYSFGQEGTWQQKAQYFLSGRNSESGNNNTGDYFDAWDIEQRYQISHPSSTRITDTMVGDDATKVSWIKDKIETVTIPTNGWFNNFTHWHTADLGLMELFYTALQETDSLNNCWFAGMSEASEYRWFLDMITGTTAGFIGSSCFVTVSINNVHNLPISHIITPISVELDLTGTSLDGKDIKSNKGGIVSLGSNKYIVEVNATDLVIEVTEGVQEYYELVNPTLLSSNLVVNDLTITTDQNTVLTLFSDEIGTVIERKYNKDNSHVFSGIVSGTYYLGIMNNTNSTIIETIIV